MFEFAQMFVLGKVVQVQATPEHGGGFVKIRVARKGASGKVGKSIFVCNVSKTSWAYYTKYLHKGSPVFATLDVYRNEYKDESDEYRERVFCNVVRISPAREIEDVPASDVDGQAQVDNPDAQLTAKPSQSHRFTMDDCFPPQDGYVPF